MGVHCCLTCKGLLVQVPAWGLESQGLAMANIKCRCWVLL
jgi:hypothetical protein